MIQALQKGFGRIKIKTAGHGETLHSHLLATWKPKDRRLTTRQKNYRLQNHSTVRTWSSLSYEMVNEFEE